jgi:hypothetical protein
VIIPTILICERRLGDPRVTFIPTQSIYERAPVVLFYCAILQIYEITIVKLFDIYSCQPNRLRFSCYDYNYLLVDIN